MKFTILGSKGFIGSNVCQHLKNMNIEYSTPEINDEKIYDESLGHVIYAIGLTSDFRERLLDTVDAHVCVLQKFMRHAKFDSFLYLSSTRIYSGLSACEEDSLTVNPTKSGDLYNISKIMGESICLTSNKPNVRIARLSNVIGDNFSSHDFLFSVIHDIIEQKKVTLHTSYDSEKDYIHVDDVAKILPQIATKGKHRIYNIASGKNTKVGEILNELSRTVDFDIEMDPTPQRYAFPVINISRVKNEFQFNPNSILNTLQDLVSTYRNTRHG